MGVLYVDIDVIPRVAGEDGLQHREVHLVVPEVMVLVEAGVVQL